MSVQTQINDDGLQMTVNSRTAKIIDTDDDNCVYCEFVIMSMQAGLADVDDFLANTLPRTFLVSESTVMHDTSVEVRLRDGMRVYTIKGEMTSPMIVYE